VERLFAVRRATDGVTVIRPAACGERDRARVLDYQAYLILYVGFIAAPLIAGADKCFHLLTNWDQYLAPAIVRMLPVAAHTFTLVVGVVEIVAAALVAVKPRCGAFVVTAWLWGIGLSLGALAPGRLAEQFQTR